MVCRELLIAMSTFFMYGLLLQTGAQYSAAGNTRAFLDIRSVLAEAPQVVPGRRRTSETLDVTFPATSSMCCRRNATNIYNNQLLIVAFNVFLQPVVNSTAQHHVFHATSY